MGGTIDAWMGGKMSGEWINGWMTDVWKNGWMDGRMNGRIGGKKDRMVAGERVGG
jgi:hypothetical protein